ncbi:putative chitinase 3, partial [Caerostris extrusa]
MHSAKIYVFCIVDMRFKGFMKCDDTTGISVCLNPNGFYPNPKDCHTFYQCIKGEPKLSECTGDDHFSPIDEICVYPCLAMCDLTLDCFNDTTDSTESVTSSVSTVTSTETSIVTSKETSSSFETTSTTGHPSTSAKVTSDSSDSTSTTGQTSTSGSSDSTSTTGQSSTSATITSGSFDTTSITGQSSTSAKVTSDSFDTTSVTFEPSTTEKEISSLDDDMTSYLTELTSPDNTTIPDHSSLSYSTSTGSVSFSPETESETIFSKVSSSSTDETDFSTPMLYSTDISDASSVSEDVTGSSLITTTIETISRITGSSMSPLSTTESIQTVPTTVSDDCPESNGIYPYPGDCSSLYVCIQGVKMKLKCDGENHFNPVSMICESPCAAKCDPTLVRCGNCTTTTEPVPSSTVSVLFCKKRDFLPHKWLCQYYFDCSGIFRIKEKCPQGLHFNPTKRVCDIPKIAGCGNASKPLPSPDLYQECSCETCLLPSKHNCLEYFLCLNSTAYRMKCSDGLLFDKKLNTCNLANRVVCDSTTTTAPSTTQYTRTTTYLPYTTEPTTSRPYTTESTTPKIYTTTIEPTTRKPYTTTTAEPTTRKPYTTTTTAEWTTRKPYTTTTTAEWTTHKPYTTTTTAEWTTRKPYTTTTTAEWTTLKPYTTTTTAEWTTRKPYTTTTTADWTTGKPYTTTTKAGWTTGKPYTTTPTKAELTTGKPYTTTTTAEWTTRKPYTTTTTAEWTTGKPYTTTTKAELTTGKPYTTTTKAELTTGKPYTTTTKSDWTTGKPYTTTTKSDWTTGKPYTITTTAEWTTRKPYTTTTTADWTTRKPYTITSTTAKTTTSKPYTTASTTTSKPYTTASTTTSKPYTTASTTSSKPYISTVAPPIVLCPAMNGLFRNAENCSTFLHCSYWLPYIQDCPSGLHFNVEKQECDYPCDAKCDKIYVTCVTTTAPPPTPDPICDCWDCLKPSSESCTKYYECKDGKPVKRNCPRGQTFDAQRSKCDWAHRVNCPHSEICPRRNGLFPYKDDCHKFVHCANGIPYTKVCPPKLNFDPATLRCTYAPDKCETSKSPSVIEGKSKTGTPEDQKWKCPNDFGYYRHAGNCSNFYQCIEGVPSIKQCPTGLFFNSKLGMCDWAAQVNCRVNQGHLQRHCRRFDRKGHCPADRSNKPSPHCDMFYDCRTGDACAKRCPNGLYFNTQTSMCDFPSNVVCKKDDYESYSLKSMGELCYAKKRGHMADPASEKVLLQVPWPNSDALVLLKNRVFNDRKG